MGGAIRACLDLGYSKDEIAELSPKDIEYELTPKEVDAVNKGLKPGEVKAVEGMHKRKDGSTFPVEIRMTLIPETHSELLIASVRNITERKEAEKHKIALRTESIEKLRAIEALREKEIMLSQQSRLAAIGQLAGGMAHEVRNPLNAILSISEALFKEEGIGDNPEYEPYIKHIRTQVKRLAHLMNDLLELGKPTPITSLHPVPLHEVCKDAIKLMELSGVAKEHRISAEWCEDSDRIKILADGVKLQQVISNLLENAIQHSPKGGVVELQLAIKKSDDSVPETAVIRVCDRGGGIPEDLINHVFEPFTSTRRGGTGLGLTLVRHFVENMGGQVNIWNNNPLPGCTAEIRIPIAREGHV
jgi:PAS domain S-box-containing protein